MHQRQIEAARAAARDRHAQRRVLARGQEARVEEGEPETEEVGLRTRPGLVTDVSRPRRAASASKRGAAATVGGVPLVYARMLCVRACVGGEVGGEVRAWMSGWTGGWRCGVSTCGTSTHSARIRTSNGASGPSHPTWDFAGSLRLGLPTLRTPRARTPKGERWGTPKGPSSSRSPSRDPMLPLQTVVPVWPSLLD